MTFVLKGGSVNDQHLSNDAELLRQAQNGDGEAFGILYGRYARQVHRYLYAHLNDRMDAEDLTEDVFLRVWQRLAEYRQQGVPFVAFLMRVAHNVLIDHYRSVGRAVVEPLGEEQLLPDERLDPGDQVAVNLEHQELKVVLGQLREDYRDVLVSRFLSGLSPEETAQTMGKSAGAVRVIQHRALDALRKLLEANGHRNERQDGQR